MLHDHFEYCYQIISGKDLGHKSENTAYYPDNKPAVIQLFKLR